MHYGGRPRKEDRHNRQWLTKKIAKRGEGEAWSETSREVDVGWTPGSVAPAVCACVRHDVKR